MRDNSLPSNVMAFAWPLWARNKLRYVSGVVCLILVAVATQLTHRVLSVSGPSATGHDDIPVLLAGIYGSISIILADTAVGYHPFGIRGLRVGKDTTYTRNSAALPLSTQTLVWIPSLLGGLIFCILWIPFALTTVSPLGLNVAPSLPYLAGFAFLSVSQAIWWGAGWVPMIGGLIAMPSFLLICVVFTSLNPTPDPLRSIFLSAVIVTSMGFASWVAPRSRHGAKAPPWRFVWWKKDKREEVAALEPFRSPVHAQFWYEMGPGRASLLFPVGVVVTMVAFMACLAVKPAFISTEPAYMIQPTGLWEIKADINFLIFGPFLVLLVAGMGPNSAIGGAMKGRHPSKSTPWGGFYLSRPISSSGIVGARLRLAWTGALMVSPILILSFGLFLCERAVDGGGWPSGISNGFAGGRPGLLGELIAVHLGGRAPWLTLLSVLSVPLLCFSLQGGNPLLDTKLRKAGLPLIFGTIAALFGLNILLISRRLFPHSGDDIVFALYLVAWAWLAAKLLLGAYTVRRVATSQLVSLRTLRVAAGIWGSLFLFLTAGFYFALPPGCVALPTLALVIAILLPANRFLWLVLNLDSVRHA